MLTVLRVDTLDEAIELINANNYANGVAIFTSSGHAAREFQRRVQVGMIGVNVPIPVPMAFYPSAAGRTRCSATTTSTGPRACASTRAARSSRRAGRTRFPIRRTFTSRRRPDISSAVRQMRQEETPVSTIEEPRTDEVQEGRTGHRFTFGLWTVGNPGRDPFGGPTRGRRRPRRLGPQARRARRLGRLAARRRPDPDGLQRRREGEDRRALQGRARPDRAGRGHGHDQPLRPPGVQGRRVHLQRPRRPPRGDRQGDALHRHRRPAQRRGLRLLGRP